eukprot:13891189-Alexandrium_andersonii.AAC.1
MLHERARAEPRGPSAPYLCKDVGVWSGQGHCASALALLLSKLRRAAPKLQTTILGEPETIQPERRWNAGARAPTQD